MNPSPTVTSSWGLGVTARAIALEEFPLEARPAPRESSVANFARRAGVSRLDAALLSAIVLEGDPARCAARWESALAHAARRVGANRHDAGLLFGARYVALRPDAETLVERYAEISAAPHIVLRTPAARIIGPPGVPPAMADLAFFPLDLAGPLRGRRLGFFPGMIDPHPPGDFAKPIRPHIVRQALSFLAFPPSPPLETFAHGDLALRVDAVPDGLLGAALVRARAGRIFRLGQEWFLLWLPPCGA